MTKATKQNSVKHNSVPGSQKLGLIKAVTTNVQKTSFEKTSQKTPVLNKPTETSIPKKLKTKSIFSPENSSESDDQTSQPPKLSPIKNCAAKAIAQNKPKKPVVKPEPLQSPPSKSGGSTATSSSASTGTSGKRIIYIILFIKIWNCMLFSENCKTSHSYYY